MIGFKCFNCEREIEKAEYTCPHCGGNLDVVYDYKLLKKEITREKIKSSQDLTIFRYKEFFPLKDKEKRIPLQIGYTPLYQADKLGEVIGYKNFFIKDDGKNPSASFKDRASAIVILCSIEKNKDVIVCASTGNAAAALACLAASLGRKTVIFVPETAPKAKLTQLFVFGANVIMVEGNYDDAFDLALKATEKYGWFCRNTGYNPFTREGKKTAGFEIAEQMDFKSFDFVFVPVGDGNIISGIWKGFRDFYHTGIIDFLPKLVGVQAKGSNAIKTAFETDGIIRSVNAKTIADSISVNYPKDGVAALKAVKESKGFFIDVDDDEILNAESLLAKYRGIFTEPAGAASLAGLIKALKLGKIKENEVSIILATGNGLKDIESIGKIFNPPLKIKPGILPDDLSKLIEI